MNIQQALTALVQGENLSGEQIQLVMHKVMSGDVTDAQIGGLLVALRMKGETAPLQPPVHDVASP